MPPFNGSGVFNTYTPGTPYVTGTIISSTVANNVNSDFAGGLSTAITKNGQTTITANIPFNNNKITGLGAGTNSTDAAQLGQVQSGSSSLLTAVTGTDTITATLNPSPSSYGFGPYYFIPAGANTTTTVTLNINGLGAKNVLKNGAAAIDVGFLQSNLIIEVVYDGTQFQITSAVANPPFVDTNPLIKGSVDGTKLARFEVDGNTTATTRVLTIQDRNYTIAGLDDIKTTLPIRISSGTETLVAADTTKTIRTSTASTLTLPLLSTVTDGALIAFKLGAAVVVTVTRQGSDTLEWSTATALNSVTMAQLGDYILLVADTAASKWRVLSDGIAGPYFSANHPSGTQSLSGGTATKLQFNNEIFDPWGYYDQTTNYRFTPLIPGWYQVTLAPYIAGGTTTRVRSIIYKNGSPYSYGTGYFTSAGDTLPCASNIVFLNGTTDYIEAFATGVDATVDFGSTLASQFSAMRIR